MVGGLVGATTVLMTAFIGRRLVNATVGLIAAAIVAVSPFMIAADGSLMAESLFVALVTGAVLVAIYVRESPTLGGSCCSESFWGSRRWPGRTDWSSVPHSSSSPRGACRWPVLRRFAFGGVAGLVALVLLVPWTIRNHDALDAFVPLSNNSGSLLGGANCASAYSTDIAGWDFACIKAAEESRSGEVHRADLERRTVWRTRGAMCPGSR